VDQVATKLMQWALAFAAMLASTLVFVPATASAGVFNCSVSSTGLVFSSYNTQTKAAVDGTGTISVTCSGDSTNTLSLNLTGGHLNSCTSREMRSGTNPLAYQIFQTATRTTTFCDGGSKLDIAFDFPAGTTRMTRDYVMYGRVTANQNPVFAANFTDTLAITLKRGGNNLANGTATISGSVSPICSVSAGTLGFGTYNGSAAVLSTATVSVNCSNGGAYQVSLGAGGNANAATRRMAGPSSSFLAYELYRDSSRSLAWGDGAAYGTRVSGTGSGSAQSLVVYGRIPAGQNVAAGSYSDSVVVTVEY
jgi:spore coat protein U-like protein